MNDSAYLIFNKKGIVRLAKGGRAHWNRKRPRLNAGEYAVNVQVAVPQRFFDERPMPEATLTIPDSAIIEPKVVVTMEHDGLED